MRAADGSPPTKMSPKPNARRSESAFAHHDALTGLPNRKLFYVQLEQALKRVRRGERLAVLYLDLDHLKRINDTLGHSAGDKLIKAWRIACAAVSEILTRSPVSAATNSPSFRHRLIKRGCRRARHADP